MLHQKTNAVAKSLKLILTLSIALALLQLGVSALIKNYIKVDSTVYPATQVASLSNSSLGKLVGFGNYPHMVDRQMLLLLQSVFLLPPCLALFSKKYRAWFPVWVIPGIIANGIEAALMGSVRNWLVLSFGNWTTSPMSLGDLWVIGAIAFWLITTLINCYQVIIQKGPHDCHIKLPK